jgi:ABC-type Mn2+/Zn2+ transport system permease subunit
MTIHDMLYLSRHMLLLAPIVGAMCALVSVFVVLRRMALISEGVSHAGFGGIGVAILAAYFVPFLDGTLARQIIIGVFCIATAFLMGYVTRRKRVSEDSAIGIFLAASVALGQLLLRIRHTFRGGPAVPIDLEHALFGDFLNVGTPDVVVAGVTALAVFLIVGLFYHQLVYVTLDEEMARVNGVRTALLNILLLFMISLIIVVCVRMVGFLMITALMIIPGATANMLSRRFGGVLIASLLIGTFGTSAAVTLCAFPPFSSYTAGSIIVLTLFAIFCIVWAFRHFIKPRPVAEGSPLQAHTEKEPGAFGHGH